MVYSIVKVILRVFLTIYNRISIHYEKNIPKEGKFILVANHVSYLDPVYIGVLFPRKVHFMAKKESFNSKAFSWLLKQLGAFPVDRNKPDIKAIKTAIKILSEGKVLAIFPQGGRKEEIELSDVKQGAAYFAMKTNALIIPIYIKGTDQVMQRGKFFIRPKKVKAFVGSPIDISELNSINKKDLLNSITETVRDAINDLAKQAEKL